MNKRDLEKLTKAQLIKLLLKQRAQKPRNSVVNEHEDTIQPPEQFRDTYKSVKQMVNEHEDIIQPPEQFRDTYKPIIPPRTGKWESVKPKPVPRKSVKQIVKEYENIIQPPEQFQDARRPPKPTRKPPPVPQVEEHITNVPVPKIKELNKALMHQSIPSTNFPPPPPPPATSGDFPQLSAWVPGFVPFEFPGGPLGVEPIT